MPIFTLRILIAGKNKMETVNATNVTIEITIEAAIMLLRKLRLVDHLIVAINYFADFIFGFF